MVTKFPNIIKGLVSGHPVSKYYKVTGHQISKYNKGTGHQVSKYNKGTGHQVFKYIKGLAIKFETNGGLESNFPIVTLQVNN